MFHRTSRLLLPGLLALAMALGCTGCAGAKREREARQAVSAYFAGNFDAAVAQLQPLAQRGDSNYVLNNLRLGEAALAAGNLDVAEAAYYRAYETLNAAGVNHAARSAATLLFNERVRIWLGEPYERAMANFQLGLIYYLRGDYANARGAFENALFKLRRYADDTDAKSDYQEQESTFAVAHLMLGRCHQRLGREDLAATSFARAAALDPSLAALADPELNARANVLLIVQWGQGPTKVREGSGVAFAPPARNLLPVPQVSVNGRPAATGPLAVPTIDTQVMARQRRWQTTDTFRAVREVGGVGAMYGGVIVLDQGLRKNNEEAAMVGVGLLALGALLYASSAPDLRQWEMVPRTVYVMPLELPPGEHDVTVSLPDPFGYGSLTHEFRNVPVSGQGETPLFVRLMRTTAGVTDFAAPPPVEQIRQ